MSKPCKLTKAQFGVAPLDMRFENWFQLPVDPETFEGYRKDAKAIIDKASQDLKPIGLQMLLAATVDLLESQYWGEHNLAPHKKKNSYKEKSADDVLAEVGGP